MTCIVGLRCADDSLVVAADSYAGDEVLRFRFVGTKVFERQGFLFGFAGTLGVGKTLQHAFTPPVHKKAEKSAESYMYRDFVDGVKEFFPKEPQALIVAYCGKLWEVSSYGDEIEVFEPLDGYFAIGSGRELALGALRALEKELPGKELQVLWKVFSAVAHHSATVTPPFVYLSISPSGEVQSGELTGDAK